MTLSCPFCNHAFSNAGNPQGRRFDCPRCGEAIPARDGLNSSSEFASIPVQVKEETPYAIVTRGRSSKRWFFVIAIALLGLTIGAYCFLGKEDPRPAPIFVVAGKALPIELQGLRYLPSNANLIFAIKPSVVVEYAERTHQDPAVMLAHAGIPITVFATLTKLGLDLRDINHTAVGLHIPDSDLGELRFAIALVLNKPIADEAKFLQQLNTRRQADHFEIKLAGMPFSLKMKKVSADAWLIGWSDKDLETGDAGDTPMFSPAILTMLSSQIPANSAAWLIIGDENWARKRTLELALGSDVSKKWLPILARGRAAAAGLVLEESSSRLHLEIKCQDADSARALQSYFTKKLDAATSREGLDPDWVVTDLSIEPASLPTMIKNMFDGQ